MSYPAVSNYLAERFQGEVISDYQNEMAKISAQKQQEEKEKAVEYNEKLTKGIVLTDPFDPEVIKADNEEYRSTLNFTNDGMMGYIEIPSIDVHLPIYHGTGEEVLRKGVGHLFNTSLPVGGKGTHTVLSAHRGLPSAKLFTDLDKVKEKELFFIQILGEILAYEIDQIKVVEPQDTEDLLIDRENDYATLITCTPYGINSHRLLIRGHRVPYTEEEREAIQRTKEVSTWRKEVVLALIVAGAVGIIAVVVVKTRKRRAANEE